MDVWKYFEGKPEIFAAVVALLVGVGAVLGAKIQANGGRDQAAAAREAARIAAEAQRVAALWNVRQVQIAEFIQSVRAVKSAAAWALSNDTDEDERSRRDRVTDAAKTMGLRHAEIELIAPAEVVDAATAAVETVTNDWVFALFEGQTLRARAALKRIAYGDGEREVKAVARAAIRVLEDESSSRVDRQDAVSAVPGLTEEDIRRLGDPRRSAPGRVRHLREKKGRLHEAFRDSMTALVSAAARCCGLRMTSLRRRRSSAAGDGGRPKSS